MILQSGLRTRTSAYSDFEQTQYFIHISDVMEVHSRVLLFIRCYHAMLTNDFL